MHRVRRHGARNGAVFCEDRDTRQLHAPPVEPDIGPVIISTVSIDHTNGDQNDASTGDVAGLLMMETT